MATPLSTHFARLAHDSGADAGREPAAAATPDADALGGALEWSFNPWRERPGAAALATVAAFGLCVLVLGAALPPIVSLLLCVVAVASLAPLFAPVRCRIDDDGIAVRGVTGWTKRPWSSVRRVRVGDRGVVASPFRRPNWADGFRSLFLPFPAARGAALAAAARRMADHHGPGA